MENIDWNKHYRAFRWAVSQEWKHKNGLYKSIQYKMSVLKTEYDLSEREVVDELFADYWDRGHYRKYDKSKGSLNNWIARYVNLYLNHVIRRHAVRPSDIQGQKIDPLDYRNHSNILWIDHGNGCDDPDYQPEIGFDLTNPENILIAKEMFESIYGYFLDTEIAYLSGEIDLPEAASISSVSCAAFRKRVDRRIAGFKAAMKMMEQD